MSILAGDMSRNDAIAKLIYKDVSAEDAAKLVDEAIEAGKDAIRAAAKEMNEAALATLPADLKKAGQADLGDEILALGKMGCFVAGTLCWVTVPSLAIVATQSISGALKADYSSDWQESAVAIEDVQLGQRISAQNPRREEFKTECPDENYVGWKAIYLEVRHGNGSVVDVEVLRSPEWIARNGLEVGSSFDLQLTEIELDGQGFVHAIQDGPEILPGPGTVVTGRFATRRSNDLVRVTFEGGTQLTGTRKHPVWAPEECDWRGLGEFQAGHRVCTRRGSAVVSRVEPLTESWPVYNIEVAGQHVYEVTSVGILVHNADPFDCERYSQLLHAHAEMMEGTGRKLTKKELAELAAFKKQLRQMDLKKIIGTDPPEWMVDEHVHHILFKTGLGPEQQKLVAEGIMILWRQGIDFTKKENLVWAPLIAGQHNLPNLTEVVIELRQLEAAGKSRDAFLRKLEQLGRIAAGR